MMGLCHRPIRHAYPARVPEIEEPDDEVDEGASQQTDDVIGKVHSLNAGIGVPGQDQYRSDVDDGKAELKDEIDLGDVNGMTEALPEKEPTDDRSEHRRGSDDDIESDEVENAVGSVLRMIEECDPRSHRKDAADGIEDGQPYAEQQEPAPDAFLQLFVFIVGIESRTWWRRER